MSDGDPGGTRRTRPGSERAEARARPRLPRPLPRTPIALSVLNLLNERPMHPYEMRSLMRERGHDRAFAIRESSVYDTVARLADRGFIEPVEITKQGRRPERTVYAITDTGRDELLVWLKELLSEPAAEYPALAAPLMFIYGLGRDGVIGALSLRAAKLEAGISGSDAYRRALSAQWPGFPRIFTIEEEYAQAMRRAELAWVRETVSQLQNGSLPWPSREDVVPPDQPEGSRP
jgi:DNA-binding PadR family transcriptional regulator